MTQSAMLSAQAPMIRDSVLKAENLTKRVSSPEGALTIVHDVSLDIAPGESVAIVGASGAGKSTLLALLAGLDLPTSGRVLLQGQDLARLDEDGRARLRAQRVGFVFQSFHLIPALTALENVMLPLELSGNSEARRSALGSLERVGLGSRTGHYPRQLSGGEQQRVALARAFVTQPAVLFDYLRTDYDIRAALIGLRLVRTIAAQPALKPYVVDEIFPGIDSESDEALLDFVRRTGVSNQHPTSSCAMGVGANTVVDPRLRVHGIAGLRVADASVMPVVVGGNTNAPTIMIGEKAAAMILEDAKAGVAAAAG